MFSGQTNNLPYIRDYAEALAHWCKTPQSKRSRKWTTYQRPLRNISQTHYRLEAINPEEYIDVMLYQTIMARYYKPDAQGHERRLYMGDNSITSKKFMRDVLNVGGPDHILFDTNGKRIHAPIYNVKMNSSEGRFSADFCLITHGHIIPEKSQHTRHWQRIATDADKATLADVRKLWAPYLDLMMYRLPEFEAECKLNYREGRPFSGPYIPHKDTLKIQDMHQRVLCTTALPDTEQIEAFMRLGQAVFDGIASKRGYAQDGFLLDQPWGAHGTNFDTYDKLNRPVTAHQLRKSVSNKLEQILNLKHKSGYVEIPQFVDVDSMPSGIRAVSESPFN